MSIPTAMAMGRSVMIVKREVVTHAAASRIGALIRWGISCQFVILKTLDRISADITGNGMNRNRGAIRNRNTTRKTACRMPKNIETNQVGEHSLWTGLRVIPGVGSEMTAPKVSTPICILVTPDIPGER